MSKPRRGSARAAFERIATHWSVQRGPHLARDTGDWKDYYLDVRTQNEWEKFRAGYRAAKREVRRG